MANWESKTVSEVVTKITDSQYVLPVIQRRLVWNEDKMELLFDTLMKGNSFGGIMVLEEDVAVESLQCIGKLRKRRNHYRMLDIDIN